MTSQKTNKQTKHISVMSMPLNTGHDLDISVPVLVINLFKVTVLRHPTTSTELEVKGHHNGINQRLQLLW